ncbi:MAG: hypothetical protein KUA33_04625, partial [Methanobacterium sp.]|nr:hypothetical protein [Methanobacterium sp.]
MNKTKNKFLLTVILFIFTITMCGAVSAAEPSNQSETYHLGQLVTINAISDSELGFLEADDVLCISNGGSARYKTNMSTEDSLQGVIDATNHKPYNQQITVGKGNLIGLSDPLGDLSATYVTKKGNQLMAKQYTYTSTGLLFSKTVNISSFTDSQWNLVNNELGENTFELVSIAHAWAAGAPADLLRTAGSSGGVSQGLLSGYVMSKSFQNNFPLINSSQSYHVMTTPGGGDDNVPMSILSVNPAQWVRQIPSEKDPLMINYQAMINGDPLESAYIWWDRSASNNQPGNGNLAVMRFNSKLLTQYGIPVPNGGLEQIKFLQWLYTQKNIFNGDMGSLIVVDPLKKMNQSDFNHLWGHVDGTTYTPGHGIDKVYISNLEDLNHQYNKTIGILTTTDYPNLKNIGKEAAIMAQNAFRTHYSDPNFVLTSEDLVITSAGYALLKDEQGKLTISTLGALDGIRGVTRSTVDNLLSLSRPIWTPLWFVFVRESGNLPNVVLDAVFIQYNAATKNLEVVPVKYNGTDYNVFNIGLNSNLAGDKNTDGWNKSLAVENAYTNNRAYNIPEWNQQDYYIVAIANIWAYKIPYELLVPAICGACPGSGFTQGYVIADYVRTTFPVNSYHMYVGFPAHCKELVINSVLGLSPAQGTYYTPGVRIRNTNSAGIFILWDEATQTGKARLLNMDRTIINAMQDVDIPNNNHFYQTAYWALWYVDKAIPGKERYNELLNAFSVVREIPLTQNDLRAMLAAGGNPENFVLNYVVPVTPPVTDPVTPPVTDPVTPPVTDPVTPPVTDPV